MPVFSIPVQSYLNEMIRSYVEKSFCLIVWELRQEAEELVFCSEGHIKLKVLISFLIVLMNEAQLPI